MRRAILRTSKQRSGATLTKFQILAWMIIISSRKNSNQLENFSQVCSQVVQKCLHLARIGRLDYFPWLTCCQDPSPSGTVCDKGVARLISNMNHTKHYKNIVLLETKSLQTGIFQDASSDGVSKDSNSTSGGMFCVFGPQTFMCWKQTRVSHSNSDSEIISSIANLRIAGVPALSLSALMSETFSPSDAEGNLTGPSYKLHSFFHSVDQLFRGRSSHSCEHKKSQSHGVDQEWFFERIKLDSSISSRYVRTTERLSDILSICALTTIQWKSLMQLFHIHPPPNLNVDRLNVDRSFSESFCSAVSQKIPLATSNAYNSKREFESGPW